MLKIPYLRNILLISLVLVVLVPLYDLVYIFPAYRTLLTHESEDEARRFVSFLVYTLHLDERPLTRGTLPETFASETERLMFDQRLIKLRVFSPEGEIVFSTQGEEVGKFNNKPYFHQLVARGQTYSKIVKKNRPTAEGVVVGQDVVETYVPVMNRGGFGGAMEVYYDVTDSRQAIVQLNRHSSSVLIVLCLGMLVLVFVTLRKAQRAFYEQRRAEAELQEAKDALEVKVEQRTNQLRSSNQLLKDEIAEKAVAQLALKSALADSQAAKEKIDGILQSVTDALLVVDTGFQIALVNPALKQLFGLSGQEVTGRLLYELSVDNQIVDKILAALERRARQRVFDLHDADQVYLGRISSVYNDEQQETAIILLLQDVTQARELEQLKSDFLAMAAHELHTPITAIMGYSELLSDDYEFTEAQRQEFVQLIYQKTEALANIVDDLLDISRMEAGQVLNLRPTSFKLKRELEQQLEPYLQHEGPHRFVLDEVPETLELTADLPRFRQLIQNLLSNAVKYSPAGGLIELTADKIDAGTLLAVTDQGVGMSADQVDQAFDRFYRADSSDTAVSGTGLGLSIVKNIIEAHGGWARISSQPGQGTRVECFFAAEPVVES